MNRLCNESFTATAISTSLRKMAQKSYAASSENERGQKVYWLTDFGKEHFKEYE
jgi:DNA-binding PadR family transcriptional regulator